MLFCNTLSPQLFWFRWFRRNVYVVYFVCMCVNAGMWFERFIIIVGGLHRDFLPSSWGMFHPTWVDIWTFIGTFGIFLSLFLLFIRFLPMIAMSRSEDRAAGSRSASRHRPENITRSRPAEGARMRTPSGHKVYAMAAEYPQRGALYTKRPNACAMPVSSAGMCTRRFRFTEWTRRWARKIVAERGRARRRHHRIAHGGRSRIRSVLVHLSADRARKTVRLAHGAGIFPDHVRADDSFLRLLRFLRHA